MAAEFNENNLPPMSSAPLAEIENADDLMWDLLSLYADGEASPEEAAQVEQMLRHDAEYARAYSFMQQTGNAVRAIVEVEPPAFLREAILAKTSHRLTFAQRLSAGLASLRAQLALPVTGRLAFAGGSLAACALLIGVWTAQPTGNGVTPSVAMGDSVRSSAVAAAQPKSAAPADTVSPNVETPVETTVPSTDAAIAKANTASEHPAPASKVYVDPRGLHSEPQIVPMLTAAAKDNIAMNVGIKTNGTVFKKPSTSRMVASNAPFKQRVSTPRPPVNYVDDSGSAYPQSVSPMMDAGVQHRTQVAMMPVSMHPDDDLDRDVVADNGDGNTSGDTVATADTDTPPKGTLVGKLQLSKLPPTARHIQTAADIQRIQEARNMGFTATVMDSVQRREADLPVFSGKF